MKMPAKTIMARSILAIRGSLVKLISKAKVTLSTLSAASGREVRFSTGPNNCTVGLTSPEMS